MSSPVSHRNRAPWFWARHELASRWKAIVVLGLVAGVAGGVSVAAVAGARRTSAALPRYQAATGAPDALVFGTQVGAHQADYSPVSRLPEVAASGQFALAPIFIANYGKPGEFGALAPADRGLYRTVARPLLRAGRLPDPDRIDEVVVNQNAAKKFGLGVGDRVTLKTSNNLDAFYGQGALTGGPTIRARVVGVGDSTIDQVFLVGEPGFIPSAALLERFGTKQLQAPKGRIAETTNLVVRLRPGADLARFHRDVASVLHLTDDEGKAVPGADVPIRDLAEDDKRIEHATDLERIGLLLFAAAAALASLVLIGQAIARAVYAMAEDLPTMQALGMIRLELVRSLLVPLVPVATIAAAVATGFAALLSPLFPVGLAARIDPDPGTHFDGLVLVSGALLVAGAVLLAGVMAAWRASARGRRQLPQRTSVVARAARVALPLPVGLGAGLAIDRGRGSRSLPTRPAIIGAVAAITGVVACFGLLHGIDDALTNPARAGQVWNADAFPNDLEQLAKLRSYLAHDPAVGSAGIMERVPMSVSKASIPVYSVQALRGTRPFPVMSGRLPTAPNEVALGPATAKALHRGPGKTVRITAGGRPPVSATVTGTLLLPQDAHSSFDQGAVVTSSGLTRILGASAPGRYDATGPSIVVYYPRHAAASIRRLHRVTGVEVDGLIVPQDVLNLRNVRPLPRALAAFLVLLGIAALGHALITAVRRRRHELAVLRALGFTPRQAAMTILAQAATVALVGLVVGVPFGILVGRQSWRWVADATPLVFEPPVAVAVILLAIPITIVVANVLAAGPARHAAHTRPAEVLRAE